MPTMTHSSTSQAAAANALLKTNRLLLVNTSATYTSATYTSPPEVVPMEAQIAVTEGKMAKVEEKMAKVVEAKEIL